MFVPRPRLFLSGVEDIIPSAPVRETNSTRNYPLLLSSSISAFPKGSSHFRPLLRIVRLEVRLSNHGRGRGRSDTGSWTFDRRRFRSVRVRRHKVRRRVWFISHHPSYATDTSKRVCFVCLCSCVFVCYSNTSAYLCVHFSGERVFCPFVLYSSPFYM